jgi:hypothetical protein
LLTEGVASETVDQADRGRFIAAILLDVEIQLSDKKLTRFGASFCGSFLVRTFFARSCRRFFSGFRGSRFGGR